MGLQQLQLQLGRPQHTRSFPHPTSIKQCINVAKGRPAAVLAGSRNMHHGKAGGSHLKAHQTPDNTPRHKLHKEVAVNQTHTQTDTHTALPCRGLQRSAVEHGDIPLEAWVMKPMLPCAPCGAWSSAML